MVSGMPGKYDSTLRRYPSKRGRRVVQALLVIALFLGLAAFLLLRDDRAVAVRVSRLQRGEMLVTIPATSTGTVESEVRVNVKAEVPGRIARLFADEGDWVRAGQLLAILDQKEMKAQVDVARKNLQAARARLGEAEAGVQMLRAQVQTKISETLATWEKAARSLERAKDLSAHGAISMEQLDLAQAEHDVAKAAHEAALAGQDQLVVKEKEIAVMKAQVEQMEAALKLEEVRLAKTVIAAPIDGLITEKHAAEGETIGLGSGPLFTIGESLFTLVDPRSFYISASIDEFDASKVRIGLPARVALDAFPGKVFRGRVVRISPSVVGGEQEARTFAIRVTLEDGKERLKLGMSADVEVIVSSLPRALFIPTQALLKREGRSLVYIVKDGRARLQPVVIGESNWSYTEIQSGVQEGELVVLAPDTPGLKDGVRVKAVKAEMGP